MSAASELLAQFKNEFFPLIQRLNREELSRFFGYVGWFVDSYCAGYHLDGKLYLVLDNSIIQDFKNFKKKDRWIRALSYVALCRFISIFSDRETCLCISPVAIYEHGGKVVPASAEEANSLVSEIAALLAPCKLPAVTIGIRKKDDLLGVLGDVHHDAEFMAIYAEQIKDMDLRCDLRVPTGGVYLPISIADDIVPGDMPLRYFDPWYVKFVFMSRVEQKIAAQSKQHKEAQPVLSGRLGLKLAELNDLKRGVLKGIGDIDLFQICDIRRQYNERLGFIFIGQTFDRALAEVLRHRHVLVDGVSVDCGSSKKDEQIENMIKFMNSKPFAVEDERAKKIEPHANRFLEELYGMCRIVYVSQST